MQTEAGQTAREQNLAAVQAVREAIGFTLGPCGLDALLVDEFGNVLVTNDGAAILRTMEAGHPASRMLIAAAREQEKEWGDGTTTTALLAAALFAESVAAIGAGMPPFRIAGVLEDAVGFLGDALEALRLPVVFESETLMQTARVACRGREDLAGLVTRAACLAGEEALREGRVDLAAAVEAKPAARDGLIPGIVIGQGRSLSHMPPAVCGNALFLDDAAAPGGVRPEMLGTDEGARRYLDGQAEYREQARRLSGQGIRAVFCTRTADPCIQDLWAGQGILLVERVRYRDLLLLCRAFGGRIVHRGALAADGWDPGFCGRDLEISSSMEETVVTGAGPEYFRIRLGGETPEIARERIRIARDGAAALQAAAREGWIPGAGFPELVLSEQARHRAQESRDPERSGWLVLARALRAPWEQMMENAGFSPDERWERLREQPDWQEKRQGIGMHSGGIEDLRDQGILDPLAVRRGAMQRAVRTAAALVRIHHVIRMKPYKEKTPKEGEGP